MHNHKQKAALGSIVASAGLTLAKAIIGVMTGSLAILSEAAHSLIDLAATVMTYFAVRIGDQPADEEHHYGHGKVESVSALIETGLLFVLSAAVIWEAVRRLRGEEAAVEATLPAFAVMAASIVVDFFRARVLSRAAAKSASEALEADALHFSSDMWSSAAVIAGLAGVASGFAAADAIAAIAVALFVCFAGWRLGRRTINTLIDTAPEGVAEHITAIALQVAGVVSVERVRVRKVGGKLFVELDAGVSRTLPLDAVAKIKDEIARAIGKEVGNAEVSIRTEPRALDDETVAERVNVIARNRALAVHHVIVHAIEGKLTVSLDLEVDGKVNLKEAHEIATGLEDAIRRELGPDVEVETHIEPMQAYGLPGKEAPRERLKEVEDALNELVTSVGSLHEIHNVRVRESDDGEFVNFHCHIDSRSSVRDVHEKVDELERALRRRFPSIRRVIGHAEPA